MRFHVQGPGLKSAQVSAKTRLEEGLKRIRMRYAGPEGESRLLQLVTRSCSWTARMAVLGAGLVCVDGIVLCALFATTDDWRLLVGALHTLTAENINNFLHHTLLPALCFDFAKVWAARVLLELLAVGFSSVYPNGAFEPRVDVRVDAQVDAPVAAEDA